MKLTLIDDDNTLGSELVQMLNKKMAKTGTASLFRSDIDISDKKTHLDNLLHALSQEKYIDSDLLVVDRDLSGLDNYTGLSEHIVWIVADKLSIPECGYARGEAEADFIASANTHESKIVIPHRGDKNKFVGQVISVASGFSFIRERVRDVTRQNTKRSIGELLGHVLDKPEYAEKLSLYVSSDQNRLAQYIQEDRLSENDKIRAWTCTLGYILWDSILRFPGVLVNHVAAASYLDIDPKSFTDEVKDVFKSAVYSGPFSEAQGTMWWRGDLDELLYENDVDNGRELVEKKTQIKLPFCPCIENQKISAGFYCMIRKQQVSLENSRAGLEWFPRGADLARLSNDAYEEIAPWM